MSAFVRVSGPPNSNFLVGYPGISATLVRLHARAAVHELALRCATLSRPEAC
jgi:hypothetical protein